MKGEKMTTKKLDEKEFKQVTGGRLCQKGGHVDKKKSNCGIFGTTAEEGEGMYGFCDRFGKSTREEQCDGSCNERVGLID